MGLPSVPRETANKLATKRCVWLCYFPRKAWELSVGKYHLVKDAAGRDERIDSAGSVLQYSHSTHLRLIPSNTYCAQ